MRYFTHLLITCVAVTLWVADGYAKEQFAAFDNDYKWPTPQPLRAFFVDSTTGEDTDRGTTPDEAWRSLSKISSMEFQAGDQIFFKRGNQFVGCFTVNGDGTKTHPIVIGAFGRGVAPQFTNPDSDHCNGNALQLRGKHQIVQNL